MKGALEADRERWARAHRDIALIIETNFAGLDNVSSTGKSDLSFLFTVVGAVVAIGGIPLSGGASTGLAAVGAAGAVGSAGVAADDLRRDKAGGSTEQVVNSMKEAIQELSQEIRSSGQKVSHALISATNEVQKYKDSFVSERPTMAGMTGKSLTSDEGLGRSN
ncbi:hypothetical protein EV191_107106 [Tamaricihabitans halophyticus]|uniref:Uncharacterized protein n=1 Tax=Tamaricihabitans halophyticus TaxID=1262583 RepID=A0A4R2QMQ2_9PSEU|nr:hypothetical protein [Tamaricihabitans halophyticus]TCP50842.1 hypothetical protein EV191_107106 [Tamaricihabitans halophyticus]